MNSPHKLPSLLQCLQPFSPSLKTLNLMYQTFILFLCHVTPSLGFEVFLFYLDFRLE
jgi:hypothetical protein